MKIKIGLAPGASKELSPEEREGLSEMSQKEADEAQVVIVGLPSHPKPKNLVEGSKEEMPR